MSPQNSGFGRNGQGEATLGGTSLRKILSEQNIPTPAYIYDLSAISARVESIGEALGNAPHLIAYAVKANSAGSIVRTIAAAGAGIDAVSGGELTLARRLGVVPRKIVLSGVAKRDDEIDLAISEDILAIQTESVTELERVLVRAQTLRRTARVSMRINPSVAIDSHAHIATGHDKAKFGIARVELPHAFRLLDSAKNQLQLVGLSTHVGSMLKRPEPYVESAEVVCEVAHHAASLGHTLEYVDFGGGFGIDYGDGESQPPAHFAKSALDLLRKRRLDHLTLVLEPGRSIVGPFGVVVSRVVQEKKNGERRFLMIDAGMNDLLRPALYQAHHRIEAIDGPPGADAVRVVGPVCESTDDFGQHPIDGVPDYVVIRDAGAYGFVMASEYNGRPLPSEVFLRDGEIVHVSPSPGLDRWLERRLQA